MRILMSLGLSTLMCTPNMGTVSNPAPESIKDQVARIKPGKKIILKLHSKEKIKCTLDSVENTGVRVTTTKDGNRAQRYIPFDEIHKVSTPTPGWAWAVVIGGAVLLAAAIVGATVLQGGV